jgi:chemotaxis protein histidine kinase CheA
MALAAIGTVYQRSDARQIKYLCRPAHHPMPIDLAQFQDAFYEESFDAVAAMERALLHLERGGDERELIGTVFRAAHSIKGGAGTFGLNSI